jgi:hypothetical protein
MARCVANTANAGLALVVAMCAYPDLVIAQQRECL